MSVHKTKVHIPEIFNSGDLGQNVADTNCWQTNILTRTPSLLSDGYSVVYPRLGTKIANSRGVPGTLGCIAHTRDSGRTVLLTNWHVLFGNGGFEGDVIWLVDETDNTRRYWKIGRTLYGKIGKVCLDGEDYYVDCAVSSFLFPPAIQHSWSIIAEYDAAQPGDLVTKTGAATGTTVGIVVDVKYADYAWFAGRSYFAPQQLLVRPLNNETPFSAEGDSGTLLVNAKGKAVGLLWGTNSRGEGVACPIIPVLHTLNLTLEQSQNV